MGLYQKYLFSGILIFLVVVLGLWFVMALGKPTVIHFENNVTPVYDEGNFDLNWTAPTGDVANYSIYISIDGGTSWYNKSINNSATGYSFSNTTDANYTFQVAGVNATDGVEGTNSTMYNMSVDTTAPSISLPHYTNATAKKNTAQLTLNISVIDAKSGTTGTHCLVDVNGTNQTLATISSGWCNSTSVNLTGRSDGNHTINVYANDTVNNFGLNNSFVVLIDTTTPTISLSKSSSTRSSITVSFSCTDATSGVSSYSLSSSSGTVSGSIISGLNCGTHYTITVTAEDNAGNTATSSESFLTSSCGGGPSVPQLPKKTHSWTLITPGAAAIMKDFDSEFGIKQIQIDVNNPVQNVKITVTKHDGKPAEVSVTKSGKTYRYLQINAENLEGKLERATIRMQVEKSWMVANDLEVGNMAMFKFNENNNAWDELGTTYTEADNDYYYYEVELDSFSYFAISEKAVVSDVTEEEEEGERNLTWLWILIAVVILAIVFWQIKIKKK